MPSPPPPSAVITYENQYKEKGRFLLAHVFRVCEGEDGRGGGGGEGAARWNYADLDLYLEPVKVKTAFQPNKARYHYTSADKEAYLTQPIAKSYIRKISKSTKLLLAPKCRMNGGVRCFDSKS